MARGCNKGVFVRRAGIRWQNWFPDVSLNDTFITQQGNFLGVNPQGLSSSTLESGCNISDQTKSRRRAEKTRRWLWYQRRRRCQREFCDQAKAHHSLSKTSKLKVDPLVEEEKKWWKEKNERKNERMKGRIKEWMNKRMKERMNERKTR